MTPPVPGNPATPAGGPTETLLADAARLACQIRDDAQARYDDIIHLDWDAPARIAARDHLRWAAETFLTIAAVRNGAICVHARMPAPAPSPPPGEDDGR